MRNELLRKTIHIALGLLILFLAHIKQLNLPILLILLFSTIFIFLNARYGIIKILNQLVSIVDDHKTLPAIGAVTFMTGITLTYLLFPEKEIFFASVIVLTLGDGISGIVSYYFKGKKIPYNPKKTIEGLLIGFLLPFLAILHILPWQCAILGVTAAMVIESIPIKVRGLELDDNILLPLTAAIIFKTCFGYV